MRLKKFHPEMVRNNFEFDGAGTRDRTEDTSLEGWGFTTKLCPRPKNLSKPVEGIGSSWNSQSGLFRSKAPITS